MAEHPIIWLVPVDGVWLWECQLASRRCHTGSTFRCIQSAAEVAGRHVAEHHTLPAPDGGTE